MGSSKSKPSQKGQIFIQAQKEMYYLNETINGQVCLNVQQPGFPAGIVQLRFVGKDFAKRVEQRGSGKNRHTVTMRLNSKFINFPIQLCDYGKELPVTQVVFPFQVPLNLQTTTLNVYYTANRFVYIKFYLVAQVINNPKQKMDEVIKFKLPIIIVRSYVPMLRPMKKNQREEVVYCCCCKNGYALYDYDVPKTDFQFGETFNMSLNVDLSNCQKEILKINMFIYGKCVVLFPAKREYYIIFHNQDLDGCAAGQSKSYSLTQILNNEKGAGEQMIVLQSTTVSPNIQFNYFVSFHFKFKGCDCCFESKSEIPITIIRPPQQAYENFAQNPELYQAPMPAPQLNDWKPQIQKQTSLIAHQEQYADKDQFLYWANEPQKVNPAETDYNNYHAYNNNYQPVPQNQEMQIQPQKQDQHPIQNHKVQDNPFG
ncbi:hypothetical protein pb186bvf_000321 [Paramecium bursaria]